MKILFKVFIALTAITVVNSVSAFSDADVRIKLERIATYLNHQDFKNAQMESDVLMENISDKQLFQTTSYSDFITIVQMHKWGSDSTEYLVQERWKFHPEEQSLCAIRVRINKKNACKTKIYEDKVASGFNILSKSRNSRIILTYIKKILPEAKTLQDKSDIGNLMTATVRVYPETGSFLKPQIYKAGKDIVSQDPAWVNGYFLKIYVLDENSDEYKDTFRSLSKNFKGDEVRRKLILGE